jgi:hypothetical protein
MGVIDRIASFLWSPSKERTTVLSSGVEKRITDPTYFETTRRPFNRLEQLYWSDGIIFNAVNSWIELICSPGYSVVAENEEYRKYIEDFLKKIEWDIKLPLFVNHMCIYGNGYGEIVFTRGGEVSDITKPLDPKAIDFQKNPDGSVLFDKKGEPVGYVQKKYNQADIPIPADNMLHLKFYSLNSSELGIGIIEPNYWVALGKRTLDEKIAQLEYRRASPLCHAQIGDENHEPSVEEIDKVSQEIKNINYKTDIVTPYWYKFNFIGANPTENSLGSVKYFVDQEIAGLGLPKAFVLGTGESQNRAVLDLIVELTKKKVERVQNSISKMMESKVFAKIAENKGWDEVPRLVWNEFNQESLSNKIDRIVKEIQVGLITPDGILLNQIKRWEGFPVVERTPQTLNEKNATTERPK